MILILDAINLPYSNKSSKCADEKLQPCETQKVMYGKEYTKEQLQHYEDCDNSVEYSRLNNPPCNLRGTGYNIGFAKIHKKKFLTIQMEF